MPTLFEKVHILSPENPSRCSFWKKKTPLDLPTPPPLVTEGHTATGQRLQQRHGLQVLLDDGVHDHLEDHLDVGGVGGRGEVVVHQFVRGGIEGDEGGGDEAGGGVHVAVSACRRWSGGGVGGGGATEVGEESQSVGESRRCHTQSLMHSRQLQNGIQSLGSTRTSQTCSILQLSIYSKILVVQYTILNR